MILHCTGSHPFNRWFSYGTNPNNASTLLMKLPQNSPEIYIDGTSRNGKFMEIPAEFQGDRWPNFCFHIPHAPCKAYTVSVSPPGLLYVHWFFPPLFHGSTPESLQRHVFFFARLLPKTHMVPAYFQKAITTLPSLWLCLLSWWMMAN